MAVMNDPISKMTEVEIEVAVLDVLEWKHGSPIRPVIVGLIIEKLQEWKCGFHLYSGTSTWQIFDKDHAQIARADDVQKTFLFTAQALGHWTPPQKVKEEPKLEYWRYVDGTIHAFFADVQTSQIMVPERWKRVRVSPWEEAK